MLLHALIHIDTNSILYTGEIIQGAAKRETWRSVQFTALSTVVIPVANVPRPQHHAYMASTASYVLLGTNPLLMGPTVANPARPVLSRRTMQGHA